MTQPFLCIAGRCAVRHTDVRNLCRSHSDKSYSRVDAGYGRYVFARGVLVRMLVLVLVLALALVLVLVLVLARLLCLVTYW